MEHPRPCKCAPLFVSYVMHTRAGVIRFLTVDKNKNAAELSLTFSEKQ